MLNAVACRIPGIVSDLAERCIRVYYKMDFVHIIIHVWTLLKPFTCVSVFYSNLSV